MADTKVVFSKRFAVVGRKVTACMQNSLPRKNILRRIFELLKGCGRCQTFVRLNAVFRSDLMWWHLFLDTWNGVGMMDNPANYSSSVDLYTDASGSLVGCYGQMVNCS